MMSYLRKPWVLILLVLCLLACVYSFYIRWAFPEVKHTIAMHLTASDAMAGDCYGCHVKATPKVAQEWYESKHGYMLVRCQTCHGQPDNKGSLPFAVKPDVAVCAGCHAPAIDRMEAKFGKRDDCATCHLSHQSPIHGEAYVYIRNTTVQ